MATRFYARVSTTEQKLDRQLVAYDGADKIYTDKMSGANRNRPQLQAMLDELQAGDLVIVKSLDRLARSTKDLLEIAETIREKGAGLKILDLNIDTTTPAGELVFTIMAGIAQFERKMIKARTEEGIAVAKTKGKYQGRKQGSITLKGEPLKRFKEFYKLGANKSMMAREFNVTRATIYRWIEELQARGEIA